MCGSSFGARVVTPYLHPDDLQYSINTYRVLILYPNPSTPSWSSSKLSTMSGYRNTPWSHKSSTLPSDRISSPRPAKQVVKGKQKQTENAIPKSKEVLRLEGLRDGLVSLGDGAPGRDPTGGCYCQGQCPPHRHRLTLTLAQLADL